MAEQYKITLPQFEGPFDLLLFFIERDELDIYDIPISRVTDDFLEYVRQMEALNVDLASEFIVVAATLMRIKSRMLLPRKEIDEQGHEIDPRKELVERLIEHKRFREASLEMASLEEERSQQLKRGNIDNEIKSISESFSLESELDSVNLYKILDAFQRVMTRLDDHEMAKHQITAPLFTIGEEKSRIIDLAEQADRIDFESLFSACDSRVHAIYTFLALLEMLQLGDVAIKLGIGKNNFWISRGKSHAEKQPA